MQLSVSIVVTSVAVGKFSANANVVVIISESVKDNFNIPLYLCCESR